MNGIGATMAIKLDAKRSRFVGFTEADSGDGFSIEGGQGYIVNVKESKVVPFIGAAWTNEPPLAPYFSVGAAPFGNRFRLGFRGKRRSELTRR